MESTTAYTTCFGLFLTAAVIMGGVIYGNMDNNKEKELVTTCIQAGGEPVYENRNEAMRGCDLP